jgi:tetratricopeptide (TPR) repeat protein
MVYQKLKFFHRHILAILFTLFLCNNLFAKDKSGICSSYLEAANYELAFKEADLILTKQKNNLDALFCRGKASFKLNHYEDAINDFRILRNKAGNEDITLLSTLMLAASMKNLARYDAAILEIESSLKTIKNITFRRLLYNNLGDIFLEINQLDNSLDYYGKALKLASNDNERAENYSQIASVYNSRSEYLKAVDFEIKANLSYERLGLLDLYAQSSLNLSTYHLRNNDLISAEKSILKFEKFSRENGGLYYLSRALFIESLIYKEMSKLDLSKSKLMQAREIAAEIKADDLMAIYNDY